MPLAHRTATFEEALQWLLRNEGGYVNHPADPGAATACGVTQRAWEDYTGRPSSPDVIRNLTHQDISEFYCGVYWLPLSLATWERAAAIATMDIAVVCGSGSAIKMVQRAVGLPVDGILGANTLAAMRPGHLHPRFILSFAAEAARHFALVTVRHPERIVFLNGWLARAMRLLDLFECI